MVCKNIPVFVPNELMISETFWQDLRYGMRMLAKSPGFTLISFLTLAVGIGANTAIFSIVNSVLLSPLDYNQPQQLYVIREILPQVARFYSSLPANLPAFRIWKTNLGSFEDIAIAQTTSMDLTGQGESQEIHGVRASANLFGLLGIHPMLGRGFLPEEDQVGHGQVVVLTFEFWRNQFNADRAVLGRAILLDGTPYEIVGILPASFHFPRNLGLLATFPTPIDFFEPLNGAKNTEHNLLSGFDFAAIGRLRANQSPGHAQAELNIVQSEIAKQANAGVDLKGLIVPLQAEVVGSAQRSLIFLLIAVLVVLLIVCVNLANLQLARGRGRVREIAVRIALGATRRRVFRQMLTESFLLGFGGGILGILAAALSLHWLRQIAPASVPRMAEVRLDVRVLLFALCISGMASIIFGILPAWRVSRADPQETLKAASITATESRRTRRLRESLVSFEVAMCTGLLILAGLFIGSLLQVLRVRAGFVAEHVLVADVQLPPTTYSSPSVRLNFDRRVIAHIQALPGVRYAGWINKIPLEGETAVSGVDIPSGEQSWVHAPPADYRAISPDYFGAMGVPIIEGRSFKLSDQGQNVIVVSKSVADRFWSGKNPIGQICLTHWGDEQRNRVIGVVEDVHTVALDQSPPMMVYVPDWFGKGIAVPQVVSFVIRTSMEPTGTARAVRRAIDNVDPEVPISALRPMTEVVSNSLAARRFQMLLTVLFGVTGLFLAGLGIFGVVTYSVEQRRYELGIRVALGATPKSLLRLVLWQGMVPVVIGFAIGIGAVLLVGKLLSTLLFGVPVFDPPIILLVAVSLGLVTLFACYLPAQRAMRNEPLSTMRYQ